MRIAIVGGHGKIALILTALLKERGDTILSIIRKADQSDDVRAAGGKPILCDLEAASAEDLAAAVDTADAVVFAAGAGPGSGPERKDTVDYGGAAKLIDAAKIKGIDRYVMVSAIGADPRASGDDTFAIYLRAKGRADDALVESGLAFTIVRPTGLTDDPGDGRVHVADHVERGKIPREDVARVVAEALHLPSTSGKLFELTDGDELIEDALGSL